MGYGLARGLTCLREIMGSTVLLIILIGVFLAVLPVWPYSRTWGKFPSGLVGLIVVVLLILLFFNRL
jgi:hypothetical protein